MSDIPVRVEMYNVKIFADISLFLFQKGICEIVINLFNGSLNCILGKEKKSMTFYFCTS